VCMWCVCVYVMCVCVCVYVVCVRVGSADAVRCQRLLQKFFLFA